MHKKIIAYIKIKVCVYGSILVEDRAMHRVSLVKETKCILYRKLK
jgi:hypothetical protein